MKCPCGRPIHNTPAWLEDIRIWTCSQCAAGPLAPSLQKAVREAPGPKPFTVISVKCPRCRQRPKAPMCSYCTVCLTERSGERRKLKALVEAKP